MLNTCPLSLLCGLLLALQPLVAAAAPAPYGEGFVRLGAQWGEGGLEWLERPGDSNIPGDGQAFEQQLESLEQAGGPYADSLAEPLASLGRHYRQAGDYQQAAALYRRAMHVIRVNDGLGSDRQVPLLRELLLSYRQAGNLEALDERYDYFFHLFGNGRPPFTQARIRAAQEYMRWQREALRHELGAGRQRLLKLIELNADMLEHMQQQANVPYRWLRDVSYSQVLNHYLLLQRFEPTIAEQQLLTSREYMGTQQVVQSLEEQKLDARLRTAPAQVAAIFRQLSRAAAGQGAVETAAVHLGLADWYFWNGNRQRAAASYREVVAILNEAGEQALLQQWLGEPVELPDNGVFWRAETFAAGPAATIEARYDVSARGRVSGLEARHTGGDEDHNLHDFRRQLSATLFRPRWASGEAEAVEGLTRRYRLLD
ncbi:tetratricopeptide repeat protein [Seongchinamella sediminis]|uniref:Tetratricopeptide repeat protein n=1 Tax=Seongchinamella sediminis TaxID=2283635 RepID=A0A3L7E0F7_9GAMM|nr:tetratricopeptide repeat protein [Seongchinamella sediminis]RLQ21602.1 tetratricopeptide repeat protein [Seongchinamella sediminis]